MSVTLTGTGGLFTRLGVIFYALKSSNTYSAASTDISAGGLKALGVSQTNILAQFASTLQFVPDGITVQVDSARSSLSSWKSYLKQLAETTLIEQVHADATLPSKTTQYAIKELIRQMAGAGTVFSPDNDVDASTVSASVSALSTNTGNGVVLCSVLRPDGRSNELVFVEVIEVEITAGAGAGATARSEPASVIGEVATSDALNYLWPTGSGGSTSLTVSDATLDGTTGNMLYNGDFNAFTTTNQPDYWGSALVGAYGTDILEESSTVYRSGTKCLEFIGTGGAPLSSIAQSFAQSSVAVGTSGTTTTLKPNTLYAVNCFIRKSASLAAGNIQIRLLNSSNAVVADDAGNDNTLSIAHGTITTSFASFGGFFRTPKDVTPTTAHKINVRVSTALTSGESVYIADLCMVEAVPAYTGGPYLAAFAGSTAFITGDKINVSISNNYAGEFQQWFDRIFGMKALALQLPSDTAGTETIVDTLIA